jgi:hypothetical protein
MTTSVTIQQLYADIVADLVPYYMDAVLLPNKQIITNSLSVVGQSGGQVRFPIMNDFDPAVDVAQGASISDAAQSNLTPTAANITFQKRGIAVNVTSEALEDGNFEVVRNATLTRLAGGLASASDTAGLLAAKAGFIVNADTGESDTTAGSVLNFIMSPESLAYAEAREPSIAQWYRPDTDYTEFRGTVRNGFTTLRGGFGQKITSNATIGTATANVEAIAQGVANLRSQNAPTGIDGAYVGIISPAMEFAMNQQIAGVGGSTIGSLSDIGNNALRNALVDLVAGVRLYRSNSLPNAA